MAEELQDMPDNVKKVMDSKMPEDLKEVVTRIAKDAEDMDLKLAQFQFVHSMKLFAVAAGGAIFTVGIFFTLLSLFLFFNLYNFGFYIPQNIRIIVGSLLGVVALIQLISGILLMSK
ncbi:hypothetical protein JW930_02600 [Candidatus Woesearchaeota archaeon]|nr:hypothetical protein [Candidatus Woesearchaeota archaeon]